MIYNELGNLTSWGNSVNLFIAQGVCGYVENLSKIFKEIYCVLEEGEDLIGYKSSLESLTIMLIMIFWFTIKDF